MFFLTEKTTSSRVVEAVTAETPYLNRGHIAAFIEAPHPSPKLENIGPSNLIDVLVSSLQWDLKCTK
jgi:hypothetical protein